MMAFMVAPVVCTQRWASYFFKRASTRPVVKIAATTSMITKVRSAAKLALVPRKPFEWSSSVIVSPSQNGVSDHPTSVWRWPKSTTGSVHRNQSVYDEGHSAETVNRLEYWLAGKPGLLHSEKHLDRTIPLREHEIAGFAAAAKALQIGGQVGRRVEAGGVDVDVKQVTRQEPGQRLVIDDSAIGQCVEVGGHLINAVVCAMIAADGIIAVQGTPGRVAHEQYKARQQADLRPAGMRPEPARH